MAVGLPYLECPLFGIAKYPFFCVLRLKSGAEGMGGYRYPDIADFEGWTGTHKSLIAQAGLFESHVVAALQVDASSQAWFL